MQEGTDPTAARGTRGGSWATLGMRLAVCLSVAAAAGISANLILFGPVPDGGARTMISAVVAAGLVGVGLFGLVIEPLAHSRAVLQDRYEEALADALRDPLTGLGNHRAFQEELDRQVEQAQRYKVPMALVLVDLDDFKAVNDRNGHAGGDRALAGFGRLMHSAVRRVDRPFRIGGDEFAILLPHTDAEGARIVARRLLAGALQPTLREDGYQPLSFSAGISAIPEPAGARAQVYSQADAALYAAKRTGRTEVVVFDPAEAAATPAGNNAALAEVIARSQLRPVYQPIVELATGQVLGFEGLIRPVPPAPFADPGSLFAAAEASGHVLALDMSCIETIVAGATGLPDGQFLSVNLTPHSLEAPEFSTAALLSILTRHGYPPERLVLELTEHQPIVDVERVRMKMESCRRAGIRLAADDVGAGYAGLRLLSELRFDILKVDLHLIQRSASSESSSAVVGSVVGLAARTGAMVIAEGIEHPEQLEQLAALGIRSGQGYLLGRPGPLPEAEVRRPSSPTQPPAADSSGTSSWRQSIGLPAA